MNIMLVTVTERTREIGIRRAIGATSADIRSQFLVEAGLLTLLSGLMGVIVGIGASAAFSGVLGWPTIVPPQTILLSIVFSGALGIFFGMYPARQAARLNPIEALRYE
jgi:putative ABC transport system permease protein